MHMSDINGKKESDKEARCPQCGSLMADMGLDFAAPRKNETKAWAHLKDLYTVGFTFHSCGCGGAGFVPKNEQALYVYLSDKRSAYTRNLQFWRDKNNSKQTSSNDLGIGAVAQIRERSEGALDSADAITYWSERLALINQRINLLPSKKINRKAKARVSR